MKIRMNRIGMVSAGIVFAIVYGLVGILYGLLFFLTSLSMGSLLQSELEASGLGALSGLLGVGSLIGVPLMFAFMGLIGGMLMALLYNGAFKVTGGLEMTLDVDGGFVKEFEGYAADPVQPTSTEPAPWIAEVIEE